MKPHKHAAVIIAWASGHTVEERIMRNGEWGPWEKVVSHSPTWWLDSCYDFRIKPKEDTVIYSHVMQNTKWTAGVHISCDHNWNESGKPCYTSPCNVKFTFDGETNELKAVEIT
jgi:hypothetical protein